MLKVAIVGTGNISNVHMDGIMEFKERCKIVALCDIYPEKAEAMKQKWNLDCAVFDDHKKMLASEIEIDVVHICTPPYVHGEISINSMNRGCHVIVEKPMATCLAECDAMIEAEEKNGVILAVIAQNRFRNSIYKLKEIYDSGVVGKLTCAHVNSFWWRGHSYYDLWWRGLWEKEGGGCTLNHAVHHIDMMNWIKGELPSEVMAVMTNVMHDNSEVEDLSVAVLRYQDGSLAQVTSSVVHHGEEQGITLQCADALIAAPWNLKAEKPQSNGFPYREGNQPLIQKVQEQYDKLADLPYEGHTGEIDNIYTAIEQGHRPMITGMDGRRTVELISAIYKAGSSKQVVTLPLTKDDPYYTFEGILANAIRFYEKGTSIENFTDPTITIGNY